LLRFLLEEKGKKSPVVQLQVLKFFNRWSVRHRLARQGAESATSGGSVKSSLDA
jgi:hypothetical protein